MDQKNQNRIRKYKYLIYVIILLWIILFISSIFPINRLGILPRTISGLVGIFASPFLHQGVAHLTANSISIIILGFIFINLEDKRIFLIIALMILISGFGTWLIGRSNYLHIGASGVIYGLIGFLISSGIFKRDLKSIIVSVVVFFLYGGAIFGILPTDTYISWEGHLCGLISGIVLAKKFSA